MTAYQFEIALIMGLAALLLWQYPSKLNRKIYCILITLQWIVFSGFRHIRIGDDTGQYRIIYNKTYSTSWEKIFQNFIDIYIKDMDGKDPGYILFEKITQLILRDNYQLYLILIAILFFVPLGIWIYKYSKEPCMSALIMSCLFWGFFAITGIRQTLATVLVVFCGYKFIKERKFWPFLLLCIIAGTIHKSSFFFVIFYFFAYKQPTKKYLATILVAIPVLFIFRNQFMELMANFTGYENYGQNEDAGAYGFSIALTGIFIVALWRMKPVLKSNPEAIIYYNALFLAMVFVPLLFVNQNAMRVVQYFSFFIIFLVPEILCSFDGQERVICYSVASAVLLTLFFKTQRTYMFFWQ